AGSDCWLAGERSLGNDDYRAECVRAVVHAGRIGRRTRTQRHRVAGCQDGAKKLAEMWAAGRRTLDWSRHQLLQIHHKSVHRIVEILAGNCLSAGAFYALSQRPKDNPGFGVEDRKTQPQAGLSRIVRADFENDIGIGRRRHQLIFPPGFYASVKLAVGEVWSVKLMRNDPIVISAI